MRILAILGIVLIGLIMVVVGVSVLNQNDNDLLAAHPPDPDHRHWPDGGDDI